MEPIKYISAFVVGFAIGVVIGWKTSEKRSEELINEEIKKELDKINKDSSDDKEEKAEDRRTEVKEKLEEQPSFIEYATKLKEEGYSDYAAPSTENNEVSLDTPYVIAPEDFGEFDDYGQISLLYFEEDALLVDDRLELVEDIVNTVGFDSLSSFGRYEDDSVFVRNDARKCDYEILLRDGSYDDAVKEERHLHSDVQEE